MLMTILFMTYNALPVAEYTLAVFVKGRVKISQTLPDILAEVAFATEKYNTLC